MTRVAYNGHEALTFTGYLDLESGKTLHAEPGGTYDIAPASGHAAPDIPEPWFTRVASPSVGPWIGVSRELTSEGAAAEGDAALPGGSEETGGEPAHDEDLGDGDDHSAF